MTDHDANDNAPDEIDEGLAFAYGEDKPQEDSNPSILDRIQEQSGTRPDVSLRDTDDDDGPKLRSLKSEEDRVTGKYVVQGELGRGGVGSVHRGHDQELGREVAVKFLHDKYRSESQVVHRFVEEAQIGGQLQHPGIVPVYDLGMSDGRPFFTMKLVKGETLAKKLADRKMLEDDRRTLLAIFEDICQTMAYAHVRGVVHRDLKPANIMIGSFGEVQVVDWGMGKVLPRDGASDEEASGTRPADASIVETLRSAGHGSQSIAGSIMGTPAYMPPEQARGDIEAMDERSDVFALGAILCEILTGLPPYVGEPGEQLMRAMNGELKDAHGRLATCGAEAQLIDLATQCMAPTSSARPRTAEAVAKSIHDYLSAVEARVQEARIEAAEQRVRADGLRRTQRLSVALVLVFAGGLAASLWFWKEADRSMQLAVQEETRAVETKGLLSNIFRQVAPGVSRGADTELLRDMLETAAEGLASGNVQDEHVLSELYSTIGGVQIELGEPDAAVRNLRIAHDMRKELYGDENVLTFETEKLLAGALWKADDLENAELHGASAVAGLRRLHGMEHRETLTAISNHGGILQSLSRMPEAEAAYAEAYEGASGLFGELDANTITMRSNLGGVLFMQGKRVEGQAHMDGAREAALEAFGRDHPSSLRLLQLHVQTVEQREGREAALTLQEEILELSDKVLGADHASNLTSRLLYAGLLQRAGREQDSRAQFEAVVEASTRTLGPDHIQTLSAQRTYAFALASWGEVDEAITRMEDLHEAYLDKFGQDSGELYTTKGKLGVLEMRRGNLDEAKQLLQEAAEGMRRVFGPDAKFVLEQEHQLASVHMYLREFDEAVLLFEHLVATYRGISGGDRGPVLNAMANLGLALGNAGRHDESIQTLERARPLLIAERAPGDSVTTLVTNSLKSAYQKAGRTEDALELQRETFEARIAARTGPDATSGDLEWAADMLLTTRTEAFRDAERALVIATRALETAASEAEPDMLDILGTLATAQFETGAIDDAVVSLERAIESSTSKVKTRRLTKRLDEYQAALAEDE